MTIERLDVVSRDEHGVFHRRFRAPDGALIGTHDCPAFRSEFAVGAEARWILDDVDPDALCERCFGQPEPLA